MSHLLEPGQAGTAAERSLQMAAMIGLGAAVLWTAVAAAPPVSLAGRWRLNRDLSDFPQEIGFGLVTSSGGASTAARSGGGGGRGGGRGRGGGSSGAGGGFDIASAKESEEDARKIRELIAGAKAPAPMLTIEQSETAVTVTDGSGRAHTFHPNGKEEIEQLDAGPIASTSKWTGTQLEILWTVENYRRFHYIYSRTPGGQLVVETRLEQGRARQPDDVIRRVYDPEER